MRNKTAFSMILVCVMFGILGWRGMLKQKPNTPAEGGLVSQSVSDVINFDITNNYPKTPEEIISFNNKVITALYDGTITSEDIPKVIEKHRTIYSKELLELNPLDVHVENVINQIVKYQDVGLYVTSFEVEKPIYDQENPLQCYIAVIQKTNLDTNTQVDYYLVQENGFWKLLAWE